MLIFVPKGISTGGEFFLPSEGRCYLKGMSVQPGNGDGTKTEGSQNAAPCMGLTGGAGKALIVFLDTAKLVWFPSQPFMPPDNGSCWADWSAFFFS